MKQIGTFKRNKINELNFRLKGCEKCALSVTRKHVLCGEGDTDARLFFVALSPGVKEDVEDRMFVGPSGKVLDRLFSAAHIERKAIYMTNLVKCTLPKNRKPKWNEIVSCSSFLDEEIEIVQPQLIIPLGHFATRYIIQKYGADISKPEMYFKN